MICRFGLSKRRVCEIVNINRSTSQYNPKTKNDDIFRKGMRQLAQKHKRYGNPRLHILLKKEGLVIDQLSLLHGYPDRIRVDNGPEFTSGIFHRWASRTGIKIEHIRPGKPSDNSHIESFNGKSRDECLNQHWFLNLRDTQEKIEAWRRFYNEERPHSSLKDLSPNQFIKEQEAVYCGSRPNL